MGPSRGPAAARDDQARRTRLPGGPAADAGRAHDPGPGRRAAGGRPAGQRFDPIVCTDDEGHFAGLKQFSCGDVVPGCADTFLAPTEQDILSAVAEHAGADHGLIEVPPSLVEQVRSRIVAV